MKKLIILFIVFSYFIATAQISDLASLSEGSLTNFQPLYDNDEKLMGYFAVYFLDNTDDKTKKFEYVFLDRNLNQVANKEFTSNLLPRTYYSYMNDLDEIILAPYTGYVYKSDEIPPVNYTLDLKKNELAPKTGICYENNAFLDCEFDKSITKARREEKKERYKNGFLYESNVREMKDGGFIVYDYNSVGKLEKTAYSSDNRFQRFDSNKNKVWEYTFNEDANKRNKELLHLIDWKDETAFFFKTVKVKNKDTYSFVVFDLKAGKIIFDKSLEEDLPDFSLSYLIDYQYKSPFNNYHNEEKYFKVIADLFEKGSAKGYYSLHYDKELNTLNVQKTRYEDLEKYIDINSKGYVENNYRLQFRDIFYLKDGSVSILTEKGKYNSYSGKMVTSDLVAISYDKNFKPLDLQVFDKEKTKSFYGPSDYLFSQYINDGNDVVFFYRDLQKDDETKDKNWNLYINTIIDGKLKQEIIPISSENNKIYPFVAKEGYILLREYNEEEKYNQIRLERLNY